MTQTSNPPCGMTGAEFMRARSGMTWTSGPMPPWRAPRATATSWTAIGCTTCLAERHGRRNVRLSRPVAARNRGRRAHDRPPRALRRPADRPQRAREVAAPWQGGGPASDEGYTRNLELDIAFPPRPMVRGESENTGIDARDRSNRDRDYVTGIQWTQAELKALADRHQPPITINYCSRRRWSWMCGIERKSRTDASRLRPQSAGRRGQGLAPPPAGAALHLRPEQAQRRAPDVYENMLVEGAGGAGNRPAADGRLQWQARRDHRTAVPWDPAVVGPAPRRRRTSRTPAMRPRDLARPRPRRRNVARRRRRDHRDILRHPRSAAATTTLRPNHVMWCDSTRSRVCVVQCHWDEVQHLVDRCTYTRSMAFSPHPSARRFSTSKPVRLRAADALGACGSGEQPLRCMGPASMISLQDEINKWRPKRAASAERNSPGDHHRKGGGAGYRQRLCREVALGRTGPLASCPECASKSAMAARWHRAKMRLLEHATSEMAATGPNASMSGTDDRELVPAAPALPSRPAARCRTSPSRTGSCASGCRASTKSPGWPPWAILDRVGNMGAGDGRPQQHEIRRHQPAVVTLQDELAKMPDQHRALRDAATADRARDPRLQIRWCGPRTISPTWIST